MLEAFHVVPKSKTERTEKIPERLEPLLLLLLLCFGGGQTCRRIRTRRGDGDGVSARRNCVWKRRGGVRTRRTGVPVVVIIFVVIVVVVV
jgi:hypothetical protein